MKNRKVLETVFSFLMLLSWQAAIGDDHTFISINGTEITVNLPRLQEEVAQGNPEAQYRLGNLYLEGRVLPHNPTEATRLFRLAAAQNHARAAYWLGFFAAGKCRPDNYREAISWYRLAAAQGHAGAQFEIGVYYDYLSLDGNRDLFEAMRYYELAAAQGHTDAALALANIYARGREDDFGRPIIIQDIRRARLYMLMALPEYGYLSELSSLSALPY